jgi:hypothetical protein
MAQQRNSYMRHAELVSASTLPFKPKFRISKWTLKQVQGDEDFVCGELKCIESFQ